jgi:hypothetical protein
MLDSKDWIMRKLLMGSLILAACGHVVYNQTAPNNVGVPKPTVDLTAWRWKYKVKAVQPDGAYLSTYSTAIKNEGRVWTITDTWETPDGPVSDVLTLEKGTLFLRKESFKHFAKRGQRWKPVAINLDFTAKKVTGAATNGSGQDKPVAVELGGPVFAGDAGWIGCLPLTDGYSTTFRTFDAVQKKVVVMHLKVVSIEHVTVLAAQTNKPSGSPKTHACR